jgi:hypothetical protein
MDEFPKQSHPYAVGCVKTLKDADFFDFAAHKRSTKA